MSNGTSPSMRGLDELRQTSGLRSSVANSIMGFGIQQTPGTDTSRAARQSISAELDQLRAIVLRLLEAHPGGLTDDEGGALMDGDRLTFGRRRNELAKTGIVLDSGLRRKTPRGREAIVWVRVYPQTDDQIAEPLSAEEAFDELIRARYRNASRAALIEEIIRLQRSEDHSRSTIETPAARDRDDRDSDIAQGYE